MLKRQQHMASSPRSNVDGFRDMVPGLSVRDASGAQPAALPRAPVRGPSAGVVWCVDKPAFGNKKEAASSTPRPATAAAASRWRVEKHAQSGAQTERNHRVKSFRQEDAGTTALHLQLEALQLSYSLRNYKLSDKGRNATPRSKEALAEERSVGATPRRQGKAHLNMLAPPASKGSLAAAASLPAALLAAATGKRNKLANIIRRNEAAHSHTLRRMCAHSLRCHSNYSVPTAWDLICETVGRLEGVEAYIPRTWYALFF